MRYLLFFPFLVMSCAKPAGFGSIFIDETLRIDYFHTGASQDETVKLDEVMAYGVWAASKINLVDTLNYGTYTHVLYNMDGDMIYSRGFDSYFKEYQTSNEAINGIPKTFHESAIVPMPKTEVYFALLQKDKTGKDFEVFRTKINPDSVPHIQPEIRVSNVEVVASQKSGEVDKKVDVAIIAEGYTLEEKDKFITDLKRFTETFFKTEPCKSNRESFNVYGVFSPSQDSGIDEPRARIDKQTAVSATFNSMGSERYVLTENNKALRNIAMHTPYDALYIMVNSKRYGGGGIYNFYCTFTSDNYWSEYLMVHEFGHSFFGLADEYYSSAVAVNDFYPAGFEPQEANITAETDPAKVKWRHLFTEGTEIPTPWAKAYYDSIDYAWQALRVQLNNNVFALQSNGASEMNVEQAKRLYDEKSMQASSISQSILEGSPYAGKVGLFEGAGYVSTGLYRGSINCIMFTKTHYFCPVCKEAMLKVIDWYAK